MPRALTTWLFLAGAFLHDSSGVNAASPVIYQVATSPDMYGNETAEGSAIGGLDDQITE